MFLLKAKEKKTLRLSVLDWGGEVLARLLVLESDTVMLGMEQIEEQADGCAAALPTPCVWGAAVSGGRDMVAVWSFGLVDSPTHNNP